MTTPRQFAQALLVALGMPVSDNNVQALVAAQAIEGGFMHNAALFNPLNTGQPMPGSHIAIHLTPTFGIQAFVNWEQGLAATVKTLTNGHYAGILAELAASADPDTTLHAMSVSPWGWYDPSSGKPNPIGKAGGYQSYADLSFPNGGGDLPSSGGGVAVVCLALLGVGLAFWRGWLG